ncbi:MAG: hypothetical protein M0Z46_10465 [Actinomycetota bacterium]|jgi:hypothetical protein|nr:hypothetical protein [Actinomycetota bacterium]
MIGPITIPKGNHLWAITASLAANASGPVTATISDTAGVVRAVYTLAPGGSLEWSTLGGAEVDEIWRVTATGSVATVTLTLSHGPPK